jgi:hypothetical protein
MLRSGWSEGESKLPTPGDDAGQSMMVSEGGCLGDIVHRESRDIVVPRIPRNLLSKQLSGTRGTVQARRLGPPA